MINDRKGFTLIELLVVIAIIGILVTAITLSLSGSQAKGRDAKRLSDLDTVSKALAIADLEPTTMVAALPCASAGAKTTTCGVLPSTLNWATLYDPSGNALPACTIGSAQACQYALGRAGASTGDYEICFYMESDSQLGTKGVYKRTPSGFAPGCNN